MIEIIIINFVSPNKWKNEMKEFPKNNWFIVSSNCTKIGCSYDKAKTIKQINAINDTK